MPESKRKKRPSAPSLAQVWSDMRTLRENHQQLKAAVGKLKDILQVQDNWHSNITPWLGKEVAVETTQGCHSGVLLWTDRYHLGLHCDGAKIILNKGHVILVKLRS